MIVTDRHNLKDKTKSQTAAALDLLHEAQRHPWDYMLFCEDDILFNCHIRHNLTQWQPIKARSLRVGSLYCASPEPALHCWTIGGSQGIVIGRDWLAEVLRRWNNQPNSMQDLRIYRSVYGSGEMLIPIHQPNLVQHRPALSTWGGPEHSSPTFDPEWKAPA